MVTGFVNVCCKIFITRDPFSFHSVNIAFSFNYRCLRKFGKYVLFLTINEENSILTLQLAMYFSASVFRLPFRFEQMHEFETSAFRERGNEIGKLCYFSFS